MSSVSSTTASTASKLMVNGLISGITTPAVINALLEAYEKPITDLETQQSTFNKEASDYRTLSTALQAVQTAAEALNTKSAWDLATATTSDASVATAVAGSGAQTGSLAFKVTQLAQANVLATTGAVASEGEVVTHAASLLLATGAASIGFSQLTAQGSTLPAGSFAVTVSQSSSAAEVTGTPLSGSVHVTATATLEVTVSVGGTNRSYTLVLTGGTYTTAKTVADAVTAAAGAAGAPITATVGSTGGLVLETDGQGATASITVSGGSALTALGLKAGLAATGTDAVVTVGGTRNTVGAISAGSVVHLRGPGGATLAATVAASAGPTGALVQAGSAEAAGVSTGNGSLGDIVANINASGLPATATAVQLSSGQYLLQISADDTGTAGAVSVGPDAFSGSPLGQLRTITDAQDAVVSVGGEGGYALSSSTDNFTNLLAGTTVTVASTGEATVTVAPDATGEAARVSALVTAANRALADIQEYAGYTTTKKVGGPLMGSAVIDGIKNEILSVFASGTGTSSLGDTRNAGISLAKTGSISFTRQAFLTAFEKNPSEVADLFAQGGSYSPSGSASASDVAFGFAGTATAARTYDVVISQSATQAVDTGRALATRSVTSAETLTVSMGTATATYTTSAGESLTSIADGLNEAFATAKLAVSAQVATTGERLEITSDDYGSAASFTVTSQVEGTGTPTGTTGLGTAEPASFTGTNVAGTIGGVQGKGNGQVLSLPTGSPGAGLGLVVTATGITATQTPVDLGTFAYRPGVAQQLATAMNAATNTATGSISTTVKSLTDQATGLTSQIAMYEHLEAEQRTTLQKEYETMETNLGKLKDESTELTSELAKLKSTSLT